MPAGGSPPLAVLSSSTSRLRRVQRQRSNSSRQGLLPNLADGVVDSGSVLGSGRHLADVGTPASAASSKAGDVVDPWFSFLGTPPQNPVQMAQFERVKAQLEKLPPVTKAVAQRDRLNLQTHTGTYSGPGLVAGRLPGARVLVSGKKLYYAPVELQELTSWQSTAAHALTYFSLMLKHHELRKPVDFVLSLWDFCRDKNTGDVRVPRTMLLNPGPPPTSAALPGGTPPPLGVAVALPAPPPPPPQPPLPGLHDDSLPPILSWSGRPDCNVLETPNMDWLSVSQNFSLHSPWRADSFASVPWETRQGKLLWRGAISSWDGTRARALRLGLIFHTMLDVKVPTNNALGLSPAAQVTCDGYLKDLEAASLQPAWGPAQDCPAIFGDFVPIQNQMGFKYILDLDGGASTFRLKNLFLTGAVVFKVLPSDESQRSIQFFSKDLVPFEHFVPVKAETLETDLLQQMQWVISHDAEAKRIAEAGRQFALEHLRFEDAFWHTHMVLSLYAGRQSFTPEPPSAPPAAAAVGNAAAPPEKEELRLFCCSDLVNVPVVGQALKGQCVEHNPAECSVATPTRRSWLEAAPVPR